MQSFLQRIDIELKFLVLRMILLRCRLLVEAETNVARQQQLRQILHVLRHAEARLRQQQDRDSARRLPADQETSQAFRSPRPTERSTKPKELCNVIDLNAARQSRADRNWSDRSRYASTEAPVTSH
jgi:hypothetical protein